MLAEHVEVLLSGLPASAQPAVELAVDQHVPGGPAEQLVSLLSVITLNAIEAAGGNLLLHAGAAARSDGGCVVLCGGSGSGKSTITAGLVQSGLAYVADETVSLDPLSLTVHPFRRPLSLKTGSQAVLPWLRPAYAASGTWLVPPGQLGGPPLPPRLLQPELLIFPVYRESATCTVTPIVPSEAAFLAGTNSSRLRLTRGGSLNALARLARRAPAYRLEHGDLPTTVATIRQLWEAA